MAVHPRRVFTLFAVPFYAVHGYIPVGKLKRVSPFSSQLVTVVTDPAKSCKILRVGERQEETRQSIPAAAVDEALGYTRDFASPERHFRVGKPHNSPVTRRRPCYRGCSVTLLIHIWEVGCCLRYSAACRFWRWCEGTVAMEQQSSSGEGFWRRFDGNQEGWSE